MMITFKGIVVLEMKDYFFEPGTDLVIAVIDSHVS